MSEAARREWFVWRWALASVGVSCLCAGGAGAATAASSTRGLSGACPRVSQAAALPQRPSGGHLQGDIDGDGRPDHVSIRYAPKAHASCGFLLVVESRSRVLALRIPEWYKPPQDLLVRDWWPPEPYLAAIVRLDAHSEQVVVARSEGAATKDVSIFGIVHSSLERLRFRPVMYDDRLSLFGTVGTGITNVRCLPGGPLIVLGEWPRSATGARWSAERSEYRLHGDVLENASNRTVTGSEHQADTQARSWGFDALPFTGCTIARGRRL